MTRESTFQRARLFLGVATVVHTAVALAMVVSATNRLGWSWPKVVAIPLFGLLFALVAYSFWMALLGFARRAVRRVATSFPSNQRGDVSGEMASVKVAILVPVYNESPRDVFAGILAMRRSLLETKSRARFEFFVLSDTRDPAIWKEEEQRWSQCLEIDQEQIPIYYRRRAENIGRKAGNLEDFCVRWGSQYEYMIVLDADSLMEASTMNAMVERMEANPGTGMLQVPPVPINRQSLFARLQQFAASVYGPIFTEGLRAWAGSESNYWGHNAIIRIAPFMHHCGLPILPGKAPLGGEILSHDFVEAALMLRANWGVELASDLGGSYEECPTNILDYAIRDQRWCQGNLQHGRLVFSEGFHPTSRFHMAMGVLAYLASPLWIVFMTLSLWAIHAATSADEGAESIQGASPHFGVVFGMTMTMLLLPKLWGWFDLLACHDRRGRQGGALRLLVSVLAESLASCLMAPIMMIYHTRFILNTLRGKRISWNRQNRDDTQLSWKGAIVDFGMLSAFGALLSLAIFFSGQGSFWWFLPISIGWGSAVPFAVLTSRVTWGKAAERWGLFLIPEETSLPRVLQLKRRYCYELDSVVGGLGMGRSISLMPCRTTASISSTSSSLPFAPRT